MNNYSATQQMVYEGPTTRTPMKTLTLGSPAIWPKLAQRLAKTLKPRLGRPTKMTPLVRDGKDSGDIRKR